MEDGGTRPIWTVIFPNTSHKGVEPVDEKVRQASITEDSGCKASVTAAEWANAQRALRHASAAAVFYLITTDILGPYGNVACLLQTAQLTL